jgi:retinol dehydrogenase-12
VEVILEKRNILVTGGGRGLGRGLVELLARRGHRVLFTVRTIAVGDDTVAAIRVAQPTAELVPVVVDLSVLADVARLGQTLADEGLALDVLFHNAGILQQSPVRLVTREGLEQTLAVNALAPLVLTWALWPALRRGKRPHVVTVSSRLHLENARGGPPSFDFDDPGLERGYTADRAYKNSKLALMWFTFALARRAGRDVTVNAVCPGFVPTTAAASTTGIMRLIMRHIMPHMPFATRVEDAVASLAFMACDPALDDVTGAFYADQRPLAASAAARDVGLQERFWALAAQLAGCPPDWVG